MADTPGGKRRTPAEMLEDAAARQDVVDVARCEDRIHVWSSVFMFGDTCACGRFSLRQGEDGRMRTVDALEGQP